MGVVEQLQIVMLLAIVELVVIGFQLGLLGRIFRSWAWREEFSGYLLLGGLQVWRYLRLSSAITEATAKGVMPEQLTVSQWADLGLVVAFLGLMIAKNAHLRRDLRKLGV